ncbi:inner membrane transporter RhtA [Actinocrispum wychmicini]|uniref:Inner membrane transporter RhtA n=2 Tax=Actinocrispum wychmicini TaxID=1213861 RepID=A0A4V6NNR0_9PSEU|nr:inner membrane transporter RhtA [Actinocrispum wychmicini]
MLFVIGGLSMYLGAALAVVLFAQLSPASVAWLRIMGAAVVFVAWRRPWRTAWRRRTLVLAGAFGLVTGVMNIAFYEAIGHLPLGTAVALEFVGPVTVAAFGSQSRRDVFALLFVVGGVALIADVRWAGSPQGVLFALTAAACWAGYILLGKRVATDAGGIDGLAIGFAVATVVLSPFALGTGPAWTSPKLLGMGVGIGVVSTVVPYVLDQVVLRRIGQARFALLLALLPVSAAVMGFLVLRQIPAIPEALGILAVVGGLGLRSRDPTEPPV